MKVVKKTPEYTIYEKRSKRYAVMGADKKWVHADDKVKILLAEKLIKVKSPQPKSTTEDAPAEDAAAETKAETPSEAPAKEAEASKKDS